MLNSCLRIIFVAIAVIFWASCKKKEVLPLITTLRPCLLTDVSVTCGGVVYTDGKGKVSERGLCYSDHSSEPEITGNKIICDSEGSNFKGEVTGLKPKTKYFIRAYALNDEGVSYGSTMTFITYSISPYPIVETQPKATLGATVASCAAQIISGGVAPITEYGFCYSTSSDPKITDMKIQAFSSSLYFFANLPNLVPSTTYYFRAYAINKEGVGYGKIYSFRTYHGIVQDIEGNVYNTIKIGNQEWMAENLNVSLYRDGWAIYPISDDPTWLTNTDGAFCAYNNSLANQNVYGKLYNWYAVNNPRGLAPAGWHIPTQSDWMTLLNYCNSDITRAGEKLSEKGNFHWANGGGTDDFSFAALPGGVRGSTGFFYLGQLYGFWTSNSTSTTHATMYSYGSSQATMSDIEKYYGCSVRCVKD